MIWLVARAPSGQGHPGHQITLVVRVPGILTGRFPGILTGHPGLCAHAPLGQLRSVYETAASLDHPDEHDSFVLAACCAQAAYGAASAAASAVSGKRRRSTTWLPDPPAPARRAS